MARKRMLSPEFFSSAPVSRLPVTAMITFAGLWCYFDDYGRGEDDADLVKAAVWPRRKAHTPKKIAADLDAIESEHLICRYTVGGVPLMHSLSWSEHQKISHRTESKLPPCPVHEEALFGFFLQDTGGAVDRFRNGNSAAQKTPAEQSYSRGKAS